jgi:hypothetical protein
MAGISNKRLRKSPTIDNHTKDNSLWKTWNDIKSSVKSTPIAVKYFSLGLFFFTIIALIVAGFFASGIYQDIFVIGIFVFDILSFLLFAIIVKCKKKMIISVIATFCICFALVSSMFSIMANTNLLARMELNSEIRKIKSKSEVLISTDYADLYFSPENRTLYTVSNIDGAKYINSNTLSVADESEYYFLYNLAIELEPPIDKITDFYIYPPTPHTVTGYDYLIEFNYQNETYVSKVFLPGLVNMNRPASSILFALNYENNNERYYIVSKVGDYIMFQSDVSTFTSPFVNVKYTSDEEFFYLRYNRYLKEVTPDNEEVTSLNENNVRFIKSLETMSVNINKINFFWLGETDEDGIFTATTPVMEIVYSNGTSDISIIKDVTAKNLLSAISYY